jgi:chaperonin GroES
MTKTEQLSTSNQNQKPKIELPNKELVGVKTTKQKEQDLKAESAKLPIPTGWRILVLPFKQKEKTKGGILLADETVERSQVASTCGLILDMGPHCYDKERYPEGPWCKKGDWIIFARYAGSRIRIDGGEIRLLNDDEVLATVENPEDIFHEF